MDLFGSGLEQVADFFKCEEKTLALYHASYFSINEE